MKSMKKFRKPNIWSRFTGPVKFNFFSTFCPTGKKTEYTLFLFIRRSMLYTIQKPIKFSI